MEEDGAADLEQNDILPDEDEGDVEDPVGETTSGTHEQKFSIVKLHEKQRSSEKDIQAKTNENKSTQMAEIHQYCSSESFTSHDTPMVTLEDSEFQSEDETRALSLSSRAEVTQQDLEAEKILRRQQVEQEFYRCRHEKNYLQEINSLLQSKLAEYFRKKKADTEAFAQAGRPEVGKGPEAQEHRYIKCVTALNELRIQYQEQEEIYEREMSTLKGELQSKQTYVNSVQQEFQQLKKQVGSKAINSRTGRAIPASELEEIWDIEQKKDAEVRQVRLENIKLQYKIKKQEADLKNKEQMGEGLQLIDFEQLKIENQTYNEKIEERNDELMKLRKKVNTHIQILAHVKEKLHQCEQQITDGKELHADLEAQLKHDRDRLAASKRHRDNMRVKLQKLKSSSGLLGYKDLLRDFERSEDATKGQKERLENLRKENASNDREARSYQRRLSFLRNTARSSDS